MCGAESSFPSLLPVWLVTEHHARMIGQLAIARLQRQHQIAGN